MAGNIFESSCQTIVNNVNCVGVMGKGIALEYKIRFPEMFKEYSRFCFDNKIKPGTLHLWKKSTPWILNFPTKNHWKYPSKIEYVISGLIKFSECYKDHNITSIAFPELGTGAGGLEWDDVKSFMYKILGPLKNLEIEIYHYDPNSKDTIIEKIYQRIHRLDVIDFKRLKINIGPKQAKIFIDAFASKKIKNKDDLCALKGIGMKSIEELYRFASLETNGERRIVTKKEREPLLSSFDFPHYESLL